MQTVIVDPCHCPSTVLALVKLSHSQSEDSFLLDFLDHELLQLLEMLFHSHHSSHQSNSTLISGLITMNTTIMMLVIDHS